MRTRRASWVPAVALLLAAGLGFGLIAGFFGARVQAFDSLAHFRAHAALALLLVGIVLLGLRFRAAGMASIVTAGLGLFSLYPYILPPGAAAGGGRAGAPRYSLLQMNLRYDAPDKAAALGIVGAVSPDVITVQEMTRDWQRALEALGDRYPYQYYCAPPNGDGDVAILSRRPFTEGDEGVCVTRSGFAAKQVDFNGTAVTIASEHLNWPWPSGQWDQIRFLVPTLATLPEPVLIAGDFNAAPWSAAVGTYAGLTRTRIVPGIGPTWMTALLPPASARYAGLFIDNVLASDAVQILGIRKPGATTSDHLPVLVTFTLPFASATPPKVQTVTR